MRNKIAQVVVDLPVDGPFDYEIPQELISRAAIGQRVLVSFQTKVLIGYIVGFIDKSAFRYLKPIISILDKGPALSPAMLSLAKDFSQHYCCSLGQAIAAFLPVGFKKTKKEIIFSSNKEQKKNSGPSETLLLHDVSFKSFWPFLLEPLQKAIAEDLGIIILVPETYRIGPVVQELKNKGISQPITILDKYLKDKEQIANWVLVKEGKAKIVIGTRSAIFAPVASLGLIVMIDESNFSYKQDQSPFYHARQVAFMRAKKENASLVFITRAFSVELYDLVKKKKIKMIEAAKNENPCATHIVDLSNYKYGKAKLVSIPLQYAMEKILSQKGKVLLVMNKKGFGSFGACAKCQYILKCPRCDIPLTFLYEEKKVRCRYCHYNIPCPSICPQCQGAYINFSGMGIEKLESEVARIFPRARVACYAKENAMLPANFDVLIATQAIIRFDDKVRFNLTCFVDVDAELNRLNFEAGEHAFSLLVHLQAMTTEKLFIQTRLKENYCLRALAKNNPSLFYVKEARFRRELHFPPYGHMAEIFVRSIDQQSALHQAELIFEALTQKGFKGLEILPPQVLSLARLRDKYRFVIIAKGKPTPKLALLIHKTLSSIKRSGKTTVTVNMNP